MTFHYEFLVMPFGFTNAPSTFQSLMNEIFRPFLRQFIMVTFDDILVYSHSEEDVIHLQKTLKILHLYKLHAKLSKCRFGCSEIDYLGHVISATGVAVDKKKIESILQWPFPSSLKSLSGFLGLTGYYRKFVHGYGQIARPLIDMLKKGAFQWTPTSELAFNELKMAMTRPPVLALPDFSKKFRWHPYLLGSCFIVRTNHHSLKYLLEQRVGTPSQQRWLSKLLGYDFTVEYRKGSLNVVADALSRRDPKVAIHSISQLEPISIEGVRYGKIVHWGRFIFSQLDLKGAPFQSSWRSFWFPSNTATNLTELLLASHPLLVPHQIWEDILMDFIDGLPKSRGKNVIFVVVDHLSKYAHFIALSHLYTASSVAQAFFDNVFKIHGMPKTIVSDRDRVFLSDFWQQLFKLQGTSLHFSSSYHPQTDDQTEVINRCLQTYLRCFVSLRPKDWMQFLILAKYWHNTNVNSSTGYTPFEAVYGSQNRMKTFSDRKRTEREFEIKEKIGTVAYKLILPSFARIHNVFHVSQLKRKLGTADISQISLPDISDEGILKPKPTHVLDGRIVRRGDAMLLKS
nr:uncharacterized protein LOC118036834 [Populus alba]